MMSMAHLRQLQCEKSEIKVSNKAKVWHRFMSCSLLLPLSESIGYESQLEWEHKALKMNTSGHKLQWNCLLFNKGFNKPPERTKYKGCQWACAGVSQLCMSVCMSFHGYVCSCACTWSVCLYVCVFKFLPESFTATLIPLTLWEQFIKPLISCYSLQTIRSND